MKVTIRVFGPKIIPRQEISLEPACSTLKDVLRKLLVQQKTIWKGIIKEDLFLKEGYTLLVNGRNFMSLDGFETAVRDGDELIFTIVVTGG